MIIYLISGDGAGAGKTALAEYLVGASNVWSIASGMRFELSKTFPQYRWYDKTQAYKENTLVPEYKRGFTVRDVLRDYGQEKSHHYPTYWIERLIARLQQSRELVMGPQGIAIDDVRKVAELNYVKSKMQNTHDIRHVHVENPDATFEPIFDNPTLAKLADYKMRWTK
jgi:hypothetical protein